MCYLFLGLVSVVFVVVFCLVLSIFTLMLTDLIAFAWGQVVEVIGNIFYPIGKWISETIGKVIKRIVA